MLPVSHIYKMNHFIKEHELLLSLRIKIPTRRMRIFALSGEAFHTHHKNRPAHCVSVFAHASCTPPHSTDAGFQRCARRQCEEEWISVKKNYGGCGNGFPIITSARKSPRCWGRPGNICKFAFRRRPHRLPKHAMQ